MFKHKDSEKEVRLISQDELSVCHFEDEAGHKHTLPSHEFFTLYGDGSTDESLPAAPREPRPARPPRDAKPRRPTRVARAAPPAAPPPSSQEG